MSAQLRDYRWFDHALAGLQTCLQTLVPTQTSAHRASPGESLTDDLSTREKTESAALMRINHTGEVCAQALYIGQSLTTRSTHLRQVFQIAAQEEHDHLKWCEQRLVELGSHTSYLNPLWFTGSFLMGTAAGLFGDRWNLGFLAETERQVYEHLNSHLEKLSSGDLKSRAIVSQMSLDEAEHANTAIHYGAYELPSPCKAGMRWMAKVMTSVVYFV